MRGALTHREIFSSSPTSGRTLSIAPMAFPVASGKRPGRPYRVVREHPPTLLWPSHRHGRGRARFHRPICSQVRGRDPRGGRVDLLGALRRYAPKAWVSSIGCGVCAQTYATSPLRATAAGGLAVGLGDSALVLDPHTNDRSLVMTSSFSNPTLAGLCLNHPERLAQAVGQA